MTPLRLLFFGTPDFAVPTLETLHVGAHEVVGVVSQPDRPKGRGRRLAMSPVSAFAEAHGVPLCRPEKVGAPEVAEELHALAPDLGVVVAFGQFLPRGIRELPRLGYLINGHASLLPDHRGAAPIAHAILRGDAETGVSVMRVEREMDAGAVALVHRIPIADDDTTGSLTDKLARVSAAAIAEGVDAIAEGRVHWTEQDHDAATFAPKIGRDDARIDWSQPAPLLARLVRAMAPRPGAFTDCEGEPLRVLAARTADPVAGTPGTVRIDGDRILVAAGDGALDLLTLQRAGGKALGAPDFQRGRGLVDGQQLGASS